ncbi:MAG: hypothetical protein Q8P31_12665 [Bacillota bacterium]|nr:hypothetical protein [Bacillota bacterium]
MDLCARCGLLDRHTGGAVCAKLGRMPVSGPSSECSYFIEVLFDGPVRLTPHQHLLLKEQELVRKRMKGPV